MVWREAGESCRLGLILACFGASCVYSIICYLSTRNLAYAAQEFTVGAAVVQALGDTAILAIASLY